MSSLRQAAGLLALVGVLLLAGAGCATGTGGGAWQFDERTRTGPLRVHVESATLLSRVHPHVRYAVSDRAHVAVFQIGPFGRARALYPNHPDQSALTEAGRHRVFSYGGPAHNVIGWSGGTGWSRWPRRIGESFSGAGGLSYLLVVAARHPLPLDRVASRVPFRFGGNPLRAFQFGPTSAFGAMEAIVDRLVQPHWADRDWAVDWSYVLWTNPPDPSLGRLRRLVSIDLRDDLGQDSVELADGTLPDRLRVRGDSATEEPPTRYRPEMPSRPWVPDPGLPVRPPREPAADTVLVIRPEAPEGERVSEIPVRRPRQDDPLAPLGRLWSDRHPPVDRTERDREAFRFEPSDRVEFGEYYRRWVEEPFADDRSLGDDRLQGPEPGDDVPRVRSPGRADDLGEIGDVGDRKSGQSDTQRDDHGSGSGGGSGGSGGGGSS